ncbi:MAG: hypothetical protein P8X74_14020 [Reinekea sp.]
MALHGANASGFTDLAIFFDKEYLSGVLIISEKMNATYIQIKTIQRDYLNTAVRLFATLHG